METEQETGKLYIGWASRDVTPDRPVMLRGQFHMRVSTHVHDPLTVTALALATDDDQCVMVSVDRVAIPQPLLRGVRAKLKKLTPDLPPEKIFLSATHTHTAPQMLSPDSPEVFIPWEDPGPGVMFPTEYAEFLIDRTATCIAEAWQNRRPGFLTWGMGYAVVGRNRRQVRRDGSSLMYGDTSTDDFSHIEGYEDHSVNLLLTYDASHALTGLVVNLACPSQVTENHTFISADFWHETRQEIRKRHGEQVFILPQVSAAGDQSPHVMFDKKAEARMLRLKGFLDAANGDQRLAERMEIAQRITAAVDDVLSSASQDLHDAIVLRHTVRTLQLPRRVITEEDLREARTQVKAYTKRLEEELADRSPTDQERSYCYGRRGWHAKVIERYELQKAHPTLPVEVHAIRLGDIAFATNPFELYLDFGIRMKARSPAQQTFLVQLAGPGSYLPSARSVAGKSYGSEPASNLVGPEGGDLLVEKTLQELDMLFST